MKRRRSTILAICLAALSALVATSIPFRRPAAVESELLPGRLRELESLYSSTVVEALRLRMGLREDYDRLSSTMGALDGRSSLAADMIARLPEGQRGAMERDFAVFLAGVQRHARDVEDFSRDNATLRKSLRAFKDSVRAAVEAEWPEGSEPAVEVDELVELYMETMRFDSIGGSSVEELPGRVEAALATLPPDAPLPIRTFLEHVRIIALQRETVAPLVKRIANPKPLYALLETSSRLDELRDRQVASNERADALAYGGSIVIALLAAAFVCATFVRQNRELAEEVRERERANEAARALEAELRQAQKLETIGQLAAGIARQIDEPTRLINDNALFLRESYASIEGILDACRRAVESRDAATLDALQRELADLCGAADIEYLSAEIPAAIEDSISGLDRIARIVQAMESFSRADSGGRELVDLNEAVGSTLTVTRSEWHRVAEIETELDESLPRILCERGDLHQVLLNVIVNAMQAIEAARAEEPGRAGRLFIRTRRSAEWAEIEVEDNGCGIPAELREQVFEPFFTTRGDRAGQGLATARGVIVDGHGGRIAIESEVGRGTRLTIGLRIEPTAETDP